MINSNKNIAKQETIVTFAETYMTFDNELKDNGGEVDVELDT